MTLLDTEKIRRTRVGLGKTKEQMAKELSKTVEWVTLIETLDIPGIDHMVRLDDLEKLGRVLNIPAHELLKNS